MFYRYFIMECMDWKTCETSDQTTPMDTDFVLTSILKNHLKKTKEPLSQKKHVTFDSPVFSIKFIEYPSKL